MALVLNEEQRLLKDTAKEFLNQNAPVASLRALRDSKDALGYSAELWQQMVELGWTGIILPEQYGGLDFGFLGLGAIIEESGRTLSASPLMATVVLGASGILLGGSDRQKSELLPQIAVGQLTLALALEETNHHNPIGCSLAASKTDSGWQLDGQKQFVLDGHSADQLIVVARTSGKPGSTEGISLFLVTADTSGINRERTLLMDSRNAANIEFDAVAVAPENLLGELDKGWDVLEPLLDRGRIAVAAEMLGGCQEVFERTLEYLKEREQFGVKIGSFQALKHRAAHMFTEIELCKSVLIDALSAIDERPEDLPMMASLAKAKLNETYHLVTNEGVQMHGGIGVTDDLDIGFFLKRARVLEQALGNTGYHRDRYATLNGY
jgi:alkylation response protein AidB-like acyl-CoA dehydrogenase